MSQRVAKLVSVNAGQPREITWRGRTVFTGVRKEAVDGSRSVGRLNVEGDGQVLVCCARPTTDLTIDL